MAVAEVNAWVAALCSIPGVNDTPTTTSKVRPRVLRAFALQPLQSLHCVHAQPAVVCSHNQPNKWKAQVAFIQRVNSSQESALFWTVGAGSTRARHSRRSSIAAAVTRNPIRSKPHNISLASMCKVG